MREDEVKPLHNRKCKLRVRIFVLGSITSLYGSLVFVGVRTSGLNGGRPPVEKNVAGVGKVRPKAN